MFNIYCTTCRLPTDSDLQKVIQTKTCYNLIAACKVCNTRKNKNVTKEFAENFEKGVIIESKGKSSLKEKELTSTINELNATINQLNLTIGECKSTLECNKSTIDQLHEDATKRNEEIIKLKEQNKKLLDWAKKIKNKEADNSQCASDELKELQEQNMQYKVDNKYLKDVNTQLQNKIKALDNEINVFKINEGLQNSQIKSLEEKLKKCEQKNNEPINSDSDNKPKVTKTTPELPDLTNKPKVAKIKELPSKWLDQISKSVPDLNNLELNNKSKAQKHTKTDNKAIPNPDTSIKTDLNNKPADINIDLNKVEPITIPKPDIKTEAENILNNLLQVNMKLYENEISKIQDNLSKIETLTKCKDSFQDGKFSVKTTIDGYEYGASNNDIQTIDLRIRSLTKATNNLLEIITCK